MNSIEMKSKKLVELLINKGYTLSTAESLTGGMLASAICSVPGASKVFLEGIVSYSAKSKILRLKVSEETIKHHSPVSEECVLEMARGVRSLLNTDVGIATTGVAGPEAYDEDGNPKGLFYIGISAQDICKAYKFKVDLDRENTRVYATEMAIELLLKIVESGGKI